MKSTTSISKIKSEFSLKNATCFGGIKIFLAFLEKIKLAQAMRSLSGGKAHNSVFSVHRILLYFIVGWISAASGSSIFVTCNMTRYSVASWEAAVRITVCLISFLIWIPPWRPCMAIRLAQLRAPIRTSPDVKAIIHFWPLKAKPA